MHSDTESKMLAIKPINHDLALEPTNQSSCPTRPVCGGVGVWHGQTHFKCNLPMSLFPCLSLALSQTYTHKHLYEVCNALPPGILWPAVIECVCVCVHGRACACMWP